MDAVVTSGLEFLRTPVKQFAKYDYKKLQTVVAAMGLPSNLKRKQLLAIIVAKKMGKDEMIPAIMKEVNRQRSQRKKMMLEEKYNKLYGKRTFPPKFAPLPPQVVSQKATPVPHFIVQSTGLAPPVQQLNYQPCFDYMNQPLDYQTQGRSNFYGRFSSKPATVTSGAYSECATIDYSELTPKFITETIEYYQDEFITKRIQTKTMDVQVTTRCIIHMAPSTCTTPWYHKVLSSSTVQELGQKINSMPSYENVPSPSPSAEVPSDDVQNQILDNYIETTKDTTSGNEDNLDDILDYIMGDKEASTSSPKSPIIFDDDTTNSSWGSEVDIPSRMHLVDLNLHYLSTVADHALWPLKRHSYRNGSDTDSIMDCLSPISCRTTMTFTRAYTTLCHSFETFSAYRACQIEQGLVPSHRMVQDTSHYSGSQMVQYGEPSPVMTMTPVYSGFEEPTDTATTKRFKYPRSHSQRKRSTYIELKPRVNSLPGALRDVQPTITPLTPEEEQYAIESLGDVSDINIPMAEPQRYFAPMDHYAFCCCTKMPCPFLFTTCNWFDNIPQITRHIRLMHPEKIVPKKRAEYHIKFIHLENLPEKSVKIIQEYMDRMFYIALWVSEGFIYITVQEMCENEDQHSKSSKANLVLRHVSGTLTWSGYVNAMYIPPYQLWKPETAMIVSMQHLKQFKSSHFRLFVDITL